jgi:hypothetical protein
MAMGVAMLKKQASASTSSGSTRGSHAHREAVLAVAEGALQLVCGVSRSLGQQAAQGELSGQRGAVGLVELLLWGEGGRMEIGPRLGG